MKKYILYIGFVALMSNISRAQEMSQIESTIIQRNELAKSGNYKDIFASFFQLASTNLSGNNKTIDFNSTLFELKSKANPDLRKDVNYIRETFSRNFQFNFKVNLNKDFKYQGFTGGFTWAAYNGRDKSIVKFGEKFDSMFDAFNQNTLNPAQKRLVIKIVHDSTLSDKERKLQLQKVRDIFSQYINDKKVNREDKLANEFMKEIESEEANFLDSIHKYMENYYQEVEAKPLWTISADGTANTEGKFNKASFGTIFLVGNKKAWNEIDLRAKLTYTDTLKLEHLPRTGFNAKAGMNFKIGKDKQQQSYFEIKTYFEYNHLFNNLTIDEKKNNLLANADFRIRLTDDIWIPITIKYDATNKGNFYGFLNVTYNFGG